MNRAVRPSAWPAMLLDFAQRQATKMSAAHNCLPALQSPARGLDRGANCRTYAVQIEQNAKDKERHQADLDIRTNRIEEVTAALGNLDNLGDVPMAAVPLQAELVEHAWPSTCMRPVCSAPVTPVPNTADLLYSIAP